MIEYGITQLNIFFSSLISLNYSSHLAFHKQSLIIYVMDDNSTIQSVLSAAFPVPKKRKYYYGDKYRRHRKGKGVVADRKKLKESVEDTNKPQPGQIQEKPLSGVGFREKIPGSVNHTVKVEEPPKPILITKGADRYNPINIQRNEHEITRELNNLFGPADGSYVVLGESNFTSVTDPQRRKYKVVFVEDINGFKYTIWFDATNLSYLR